MFSLIVIINILFNINYALFYLTLFSFLLNRFSLYSIKLIRQMKGYFIFLKNKIRNKSITDGSGNVTEFQCSICYNFIDNNNISKIPCNHIFCSTCIIRWGSNNNSCPNCRTIIFKENNVNIENNNQEYNITIPSYMRIRRRNAVLLENDQDYLNFINQHQTLNLPEIQDED